MTSPLRRQPHKHCTVLRLRGICSLHCPCVKYATDAVWVGLRAQGSEASRSGHTGPTTKHLCPQLAHPGAHLRAMQGRREVHGGSALILKQHLEMAAALPGRARVACGMCSVPLPPGSCHPTASWPACLQARWLSSEG